MNSNRLAVIWHERVNLSAGAFLLPCHWVDAVSQQAGISPQLDHSIFEQIALMEMHGIFT